MTSDPSGTNACSLATRSAVSWHDDLPSMAGGAGSERRIGAVCGDDGAHGNEGAGVYEEQQPWAEFCASPLPNSLPYREVWIPSPVESRPGDRGVADGSYLKERLRKLFGHRGFVHLAIAPQGPFGLREYWHPV